MLNVGQVLDQKYRIVRLVGEGGMGAVYEAEHTFLGRRVAIKVLSAEFAHNIDAVRRFYREAQAAAHIGHENICEVADVGQTDGSPYIVMQLLQGKSLAQAIVESAPFPVGRVVDIAQQTLEALAAAHDAGIVHRDMKPDNIFLIRVAGRDDFVKLLDFGISKVRIAGAGSTNLTQAGAVFGTPQYMSPEQARGTTDVDGRADIWAVGVIVFEMLTGRIPFDGENYNQIIFDVVSAPIPRLRALREGITPELETVVMRAMERNLDRRFRTALEFRDALLGAWMSTQDSGFAVKARTTVPPIGEDATELMSMHVMPPVMPKPRSGGVVIGTPVPTPGMSAGSDGPTVSNVFVAEFSTPAPAAAPVRAPQAPPIVGSRGKFGTVNATPGATLAHALPTTAAPPAKRRLPVIPVAIAAAAVTGILVFLLVRGIGDSGGTQEGGTTTTVAAVTADAGAPGPTPPTNLVPAAAPDAGPGGRPGELTKPVVEQGGTPAISPPVVPSVPDAAPATPVEVPDSGGGQPVSPPVQDAGRTPRDAAAAPATGTGKLSVATVPWTNVFLDGEFFARAPFTGRAVTVGRHRLRFVNEAAGVNHEETVDVAPEGVTSVRRTAAQLGANMAGSTDAGGRVSGPPDAGQAQDALRFRFDVYRRDSR